MRHLIGWVIVLTLAISGIGYASPEKPAVFQEKCMEQAAAVMSEMQKSGMTGTRTLDGCGAVTREDSVSVETVGGTWERCSTASWDDPVYGYTITLCAQWTDNDVGQITWFRNPPYLSVTLNPGCEVMSITNHAGLTDPYHGFAYSNVRLACRAPFFPWPVTSRPVIELIINFP